MIHILSRIFNTVFGTKPLQTYIQLSKAIAQQFEKRNTQFSLLYTPKNRDILEADIDYAIEFLDVTSPYSYRSLKNYRCTYTEQQHAVKISFTIVYETSEAEEQFVQDELRRIASTILQKNQSNLEIVKAVHDYVLMNFTYNLETKRSPYTVHTLLTEKQGVCQAMALFAFKLFQQVGIPCYYVTGYGINERHGWNLVQLDGHWYHLDITWDNPNYGNDFFENYRFNYDYFLLTDAQISSDHTFDQLYYPPANNERYASFHKILGAIQINDELYFPNSEQDELLYKLNLKDPSFALQPVLNTRVQFLSYYGGALYFSNYSNSGYLYKYHLMRKELTLLSYYEVTNTRIQDTSLYIQNTLGDITCIPLNKQ